MFKLQVLIDGRAVGNHVAGAETVLVETLIDVLQAHLRIVALHPTDGPGIILGRCGKDAEEEKKDKKGESTHKEILILKKKECAI